MSRLETWCCDSCGETTLKPDRAAWSQVYGATLDGTDIIGTNERAADLCPSCTHRLRSLFVAASQPAEQAPPPAQTPKVRKPRNNPLALANADCGALLPGGDLARLDPEHEEYLA